MNCSRCGIDIDITIIEKRQARGNYNTNCRDCNAKPAREVKYNNQICRVWLGELDDDWNPIDKHGNLYQPGVRICGHKDCVNKKHIIPDIENERLDISYRTGKKFDMKRVMRERVA